MATKDIEHAGLREDPRHAVIVKALGQPMGVEREWTVRHIEGRGTVSGIGPTPLWLDSVEGTADFIVSALRANDSSASVDLCGCEPNEFGDIRCHVCGERVNRSCWNCGTPRGGGSCPNALKSRDRDIDQLRSAANPIHEETCRDEHDENETPESDWPCMLLARRVLASAPPQVAPSLETQERLQQTLRQMFGKFVPEDHPYQDVLWSSAANVILNVYGAPSTPPRVQRCPDCRDGKHHNCAGFAFDADDNAVQCPCPSQKCRPITVGHP